MDQARVDRLFKHKVGFGQPQTDHCSNSFVAHFCQQTNPVIDTGSFRVGNSTAV